MKFYFTVLSMFYDKIENNQRKNSDQKYKKSRHEGQYLLYVTQFVYFFTHSAVPSIFKDRPIVSNL